MRVGVVAPHRVGYAKAHGPQAVEESPVRKSIGFPQYLCVGVAIQYEEIDVGLRLGAWMTPVAPNLDWSGELGDRRAPADCLRAAHLAHADLQHDLRDQEHPHERHEHGKSAKLRAADDQPGKSRDGEQSGERAGSCERVPDPLKEVTKPDEVEKPDNQQERDRRRDVVRPLASERQRDHQIENSRGAHYDGEDGRGGPRPNTRPGLPQPAPGRGAPRRGPDRTERRTWACCGREEFGRQGSDDSRGRLNSRAQESIRQCVPAAAELTEAGGLLLARTRSRFRSGSRAPGRGPGPPPADWAALRATCRSTGR